MMHLETCCKCCFVFSGVLLDSWWRIGNFLVEKIKTVDGVVTAVGLIIPIVLLLREIFARMRYNSETKMPFEFYLDKQIKMYTDLSSATDNLQAKEWFVNKVVLLQKQKTAFYAVNKIIGNPSYILIGILYLCISIIFFGFHVLTSEGWLSVWSSFGVVSYFVALIYLIITSVSKTEKNELYFFYLDILESEYKEIVIKEPIILFEKYYKNTLTKFDKFCLWFIVNKKGKNNPVDKVRAQLDEESKKEADNGGETQC